MTTSGEDVTPRRTLRGLVALHPNAAIEEVGDRRELVIYTGLSAGLYDAARDEWTETKRLHPMPEALD